MTDQDVETLDFLEVPAPRLNGPHGFHIYKARVAGGYLYVLDGEGRGGITFAPDPQASIVVPD